MEVISPISSDILRSISREQAQYYKIVPFDKKGETLCLYSASSADPGIESELEIVLNRPVELTPLDTHALLEMINRYYRVDTENRQQLRYSPDFILEVIESAHDLSSSDIHFESMEDRGRIRMRVDGKLMEQYFVSPSEYPTLVNRIKIMAQLDIAEKRRPQDGRIDFTHPNGSRFDIRVSSLPTLHGEKLVLRLLDNSKGDFSLEDLGMSPVQTEEFRNALLRPQGMVLISGPTGSGKTTTLYSALSLLNSASVNILTIEDPVEYTLKGINQVALKEQIGLDFSSAMRTFLRQDPDIIMVGEIRDARTAEMAVKASLTGHLVLSTIHTNSAWGTVTRLQDMGIAPYLLASTLHLSIAQRLVRRLCEHCKTPVRIDPKALPITENIPDLSHCFGACGCAKCFQTGYKGRVALYEILPIDATFQGYIREGKSLDRKELLKRNRATLADLALTSLAQGITSLEEVYPIFLSSQ